MTEPILEVREVHKRYGDNHALRGVSFAVQEKEVFGLQTKLLDGWRTAPRAPMTGAAVPRGPVDR